MNETNLTLYEIDQRINTLKLIKLNKLKSEEKQHKYSRNFGLWLTERFNEPITSVKWSAHGGAYLEHQWDGTPDPFYAMTEAIADRNWVGVESATGTGKTYMLARVIYWFLDTWGGTCITTAPKQQQLKDILWAELIAAYPKFLKIRPHAEMYNMALLPMGKLIDRTLFDSEEKLRDSKISKAVGIVAGVGANEDSAVKMQGYHDDPMLFVIDECAGISPAVMKAIKNTCTDPENNIIVGMGNPDTMTDQLHEFCEMQNVVHIRISAYDHPNNVLKKKVIPGAVTTRSIEIRADEYGKESPFFQSRVRGIAPKQGADSLFSLAWMERAVKEDFQPVALLHERMSRNALGVDVANSLSGDMACLVWGKGAEVGMIHEFQCPDASHLAYNLFMEADELSTNSYHDYNTRKLNSEDYEITASCIGIDGVGVGTATVQTLRNNGINAISLMGGALEEIIPMDEEEKPLWAFNNLRSQMFWELREDLRLGTLAIRIGDRILLKKLFKELMAHSYSTKSGKIVVLKKDEVKKIIGGKSPNMADALAYWNFVRKGFYVAEYVPLPRQSNDDDD